MKKIIALVLCLCMIAPAIFASAEEVNGEFIYHYSEAESVGAWSPSFTIQNYDNGAQTWTNKQGDTMVYTLKELKAGNYEVFYYVAVGASNVEKTEFIVNHNGKNHKIFALSRPDAGGPATNEWVSMGVLDFEGSGEETMIHIAPGVDISRGTGIKLVPTKQKVSDAEEVDPTKISGMPKIRKAGDSEPAKVDSTKYDNEIIYHYSKAESVGKWAESMTLPNYDGGAQTWNQTKGDTMVYTLNDIKAGNYEMFYYVVCHSGNIEKTSFTVNHNGKTDVVHALSNPDKGGPTQNGWVSMGVLDFSGSGDETFKHVHPGGGHSRGTGLKLVPTDKEISVFEAVEEEVIPETSPDGVPLVGEKKPDTSKPLVNITEKASGVCEWTGGTKSDGTETAWAFSAAVTSPMSDFDTYMSLWIAGVGNEATVTYKPQYEAAKNVNVFVYLLYWHENQNPNVKYEIHHNGKVDEVKLDPTTLTASSWVYLGTFDFAGNPDEEFVKLVCQETDNIKENTRASTVMFETVDADGKVTETKYVTPLNEIEPVDLLKDANLAPLNKFADMAEHWAHYDVEYMANEGLVAGKGEDAFDPEAQITRAEYLTILDRAMGYEEVKEDFFPDVTSDSWYYGYVGAAKKNGLIEGLPTDDGFKPTQPITREEMALFTYNAIKAVGKNDEWVATMPDDFAKFTDTDEVSDWAKEAMQYLVQTGIIKGMTETTAAPRGNATRAQGAVILKRFMQLFVWAGPPKDQEWVLMFNDEFNGTEMDWSVWRSDASAPGHILSSRWPENIEVRDGSVHLLIKKESKGGKFWTAGSAWVRPEVFAQTYGYWEARYKYAAASGINNSFWTYVPHSHNIHMNPDEKTHFELDVNEGHYPNEIAMNYHTWVTGERLQHGGSYKSQYDLSADYHTYALEWTPTELKYYHDGKLIRTQENFNAHQLQFPYISSAVINWAGQVTSQADGTAQIIDYVRVWQKKENVENSELNHKGEPMVGASPTDANAPVILKDSEGNAVQVKTVTVADQMVDTNTYDGEIIIEAEVSEHGNWRESSAIRNFNGGIHKWTDIKGAESWYSLKNVAKGEYKVYFWRLPHSNNLAQMNFMLEQDGKDAYAGSAALVISQGTAEPGWVEIGTVKLTGDENARITYVCPGGNCRASAVKLVPVK